MPLQPPVQMVTASQMVPLHDTHAHPSCQYAVLSACLRDSDDWLP
jgi:hypothetical protein